MGQISGHGGEVLVGGYQSAGKIGPWSLAQSETGWTVHVTLVRRDPYWIERRPMRLVLELGHLSWSWDDVHFDGNQIFVVTGAPREGIVDAA